MWCSGRWTGERRKAVLHWLPSRCGRVRLRSRHCGSEGFQFHDDQSECAPDRWIYPDIWFQICSSGRASQSGASVVAGQSSILDDAEQRARWDGFAWTDENARPTKEIIGWYPEGRQVSAVIPLLD